MRTQHFGRTAVLALTVALSAASALAQSSTLTFDDLSAGPSTNNYCFGSTGCGTAFLETQGYRVTADLSYVINTPANFPNGSSSVGLFWMPLRDSTERSPYIGFAQEQITFSQASGGAFSLKSFDVADGVNIRGTLAYLLPDAILVTGARADGRVVSQQIDLDGTVNRQGGLLVAVNAASFQTVQLSSDFSNLTSFSVSALNVTEFSPDSFFGNGVSIDNVVVQSAITPVPEPATVALMLPALGLLALVRRRARKPSVFDL